MEIIHAGVNLISAFYECVILGLFFAFAQLDIQKNYGIFLWTLFDPLNSLCSMVDVIHSRNRIQCTLFLKKKHHEHFWISIQWNFFSPFISHTKEIQLESVSTLHVSIVLKRYSQLKHVLKTSVGIKRVRETCFLVNAPARKDFFISFFIMAFFFVVHSSIETSSSCNAHSLTIWHTSTENGWKRVHTKPHQQHRINALPTIKKTRREEKKAAFSLLEMRWNEKRRSE